MVADVEERGAPVERCRSPPRLGEEHGPERVVVVQLEKARPGGAAGGGLMMSLAPEKAVFLESV